MSILYIISNGSSILHLFFSKFQVSLSLTSSLLLKRRTILKYSPPSYSRHGAGPQYCTLFKLMGVFRLKGEATRNMGKDVVAITQVFFIYRKPQAVFGLSVVNFTASLTTVLESEEGTWVT